MQIILSKPGNEFLPRSDQEFYELRMDDSPNPDRPGFIVMQSRAQWSDADRCVMWDQIETEHLDFLQAARNCFMARLRTLSDQGFTLSNRIVDLSTQDIAQLQFDSSQRSK